ncbi:hypothetical protein GCM10025868_34750 [Angustibacter aerolatus]|uniref:TRAP C4-dicarboxylate transport system permease DctM subunit domain-containing protein n=1 Tax=Angustibacter aerolatus TaxID=1162965 RepID=A0ABQ6JN85_9ACTN|nr:hypothetical protein GCM10025868_34750 [Angustibacter aerolatus]
MSAPLFTAMTVGSAFTETFSAAGVARYFSSALAPASFFGRFDIMYPSIGASIAPVPIDGSISGKVKKSRSSRSPSGNCWPTNMPST